MVIVGLNNTFFMHFNMIAKKGQLLATQWLTDARAPFYFTRFTLKFGQIFVTAGFNLFWKIFL